jgi:hypothetical protein
MTSAVINTTLSNAINSSDGYHHLVYSISGTTHTIFLDNSAIAINVNGGNMFTNYQNISNLFIGIAGDLSYGYTGLIDEFKIYNRALITADVSAIYNTLVVPKSIYSSSVITSNAQLIFPFIADLTNKGLYTNISSSNVSITYGTTSFATYATKIGLNNASLTISGLYATNLFTQGYTISMWFYLQNNIGDWNTGPIITNDNATAQIMAWNPCNAPWNRTDAGLYFANNNAFIGTNYSPNNTWQQLVVTINSSKTCTYYINGTNRGNITGTNVLNLDSILLFPNPSNTWGTAYPTPGRLLSVFNNVLTSSQVTQLYNEQLNL